MTLTNKQRAARCEQAIAHYSDDDHYTNLIDWIADAMHWCYQNDHDMADAWDNALMHFNAEILEGRLL